MLKLILLAHAAATLIMTGVIWIVQVVHYPLFAKVGESSFLSYHADHNVLITYIVLPTMLVEIGTAYLLVLNRPVDIPFWLIIAGAVAVTAVWAATFFLSVPQHSILGRGFDANAHTLLVNTNWVRTILWSARSIIALWMIALLMK